MKLTRVIEERKGYESGEIKEIGLVMQVSDIVIAYSLKDVILNELVEIEASRIRFMV